MAAPRASSVSEECLLRLGVRVLRFGVRMLRFGGVPAPFRSAHAPSRKKVLDPSGKLYHITVADPHASSVSEE